MAEFNIELELQGLKLRVRGSREDVPVAIQQIGRQFTGMLAPIANVVDGEFETEAPAAPIVTQATPVVTPKRTRKAKRAPVANGASAASDDVITWSHDASRWGHPLKKWKGWEKAVWLLSVITTETENAGLTTSQLVRSFNAKFEKSAGKLAHISINRDLSQRQAAPHLLVQQNDERWELLDNGKAQAQTLVAAALGQDPVTAGA